LKRGVAAVADELLADELLGDISWGQVSGFPGKLKAIREGGSLADESVK
jgi:hypothetical protein